MFRTVSSAFGIVLSLAQVSAAPSTSNLTFVGDSLVARYNAFGAQGGLIEFVPPDETIGGWTRLVGYRAFLESRQSASEAAAALGHQTRERFPGINPTLYERRNEAVVEFALPSPDGTIEYNVFRYAIGPGGHGLVSLQYARRLRGHDVHGMPNQAPRWAAEVARFDMNRVRAAFAQLR
ncbi:hypothetical protein [Methylobacterium trifolii]|uniref:SRPBCC family protein n=1 Tax=Methylobacterium trifolii TaxID=1003092 RepID=A0ABQ4U5X2_9HYPH|nr:hypothetical protein [Methylobacterium trifolii]GJE61763.1 hypothetical protein MPOCJGCO_3889 [Methylobacterium trifolii]